MGTYLKQIDNEIYKLKTKNCFYEYDEFCDFRKIGESRFGMIVYKSKWRKRNFAVVHKSVEIDIIRNNKTEIDTIQGDKIKNTMQNIRAFQELITEIQQLQKVGFHDNIINFYGIAKGTTKGMYSKLFLAD
ncbi:8907_t:CDS:2 [Racocetra fulgida]|uniref:8907_t:CDS:1 n=1 Tax=Racocetra fulgida TaxID=60492 RepID=A0A9N8VBH1_9GLOM|nr:8907_t:CDS:2 [Racocetra fulgida]